MKEAHNKGKKRCIECGRFFVPDEEGEEHNNGWECVRCLYVSGYFDDDGNCANMADDSEDFYYYGEGQYGMKMS